jgi:hypothetical protein
MRSAFLTLSNKSIYLIHFHILWNINDISLVEEMDKYNNELEKVNEGSLYNTFFFSYLPQLS